MHWIRHKPTTSQVLPSKAGTQANSQIEAAAPPMSGPKILSQDPSRSAQQSELCALCKVLEEALQTWLVSSHRILKWAKEVFAVTFTKMLLQALTRSEGWHESMGLIEQAAALRAYILCKIIKKKKNPVLDLGQYHLPGNSQMGVSRICTSPLPFQGSGSPSYFANNSSSHPTACSHFLLRTCLWLSTSTSQLWLGFTLKCSKLKTKLQARHNQ